MGLLSFAKDIGKKLFNREEDAPEKISAYIEEDNPGVSNLKVDVKDGVVTLAGTWGGLGRAIRLRHANGYETIYGHLSRVSVRRGQRVSQGERIGAVGSTGLATGRNKARKLEYLMADALRHAAGNFYVNDKPTGAVVGQQPFGGSRASGTNDKAGSAANLMRWVSTRTIKETFVPPTSFEYPFMGEE